MYQQTKEHKKKISDGMKKAYRRKGIKPKPKPQKEIIIYENSVPRLRSSNKTDWKEKYRDLEIATRRFLTNKGTGNTEKVNVRDSFIESFNKITG